MTASRASATAEPHPGGRGDSQRRASLEKHRETIKAHLSEIVHRVEEQHERVTLTRNGRPAAVLISPEDLEPLEDTLELLADPAPAEIDRARRDIASGKGIRADELRARYPSKA